MNVDIQAPNKNRKVDKAIILALEDYGHFTERRRINGRTLRVEVKK